VDETPVKGLTDADKAYLHPHQVEAHAVPRPDQLPFDPLQAGLGLSALAAILWQRRRIAQGVHGAGTAAKYAGGKIRDGVRQIKPPLLEAAMNDWKAVSDEDLRTAKEVIHTLQFDPSRDIIAAIARGKQTMVGAWETPRVGFTKPAMRGQEVELLLKAQLAAATDPQEQAALARSLELARQVWDISFADRNAAAYWKLARLPGYRSRQLRRAN
jgi:hypothetical protein